jgi:AcrR family transcriptional regulator
MRRGRAGTPGPRGGGVYLSQMQQTRLLDAAAAIVVEQGVGRLTARTVSACAGMSTKTFYDLFADSEDCLLAVFDRAVGDLATAVVPAWAGEDQWVARVRAALAVLLAYLDREPELCRVVFVEALAGGPRVLERRASVLDGVARAVDEGRAGSAVGAELPQLTAAGVTGAAFSLIHARLLERERSGSLLELLGPVMATVVFPYRGREESARELARPVPEPPELPERRVSTVRPELVEGAAVAPAQAGRMAVRPTPRTFMVLAAVAALGGESSRRVARRAEISDEAQISRMLARLEDFALVENKAAHSTVGLPKEWWLTAAGEEFLRTGHATRPANTPRAKSSQAKRTRRAASVRARRPGARRVLNGGALLPGGEATDARRRRLLRAAAAAVDEHGYGAVTVTDIAGHAKISRRTFYELFSDREDCLLAVMLDIDAQLTSELRAADLDGLPWRERLRLGLWTVLRFFDREPALARFCVVESARGDDRMAVYRAELLARFAGVIVEGAGEGVLGRDCSPLLAEGLAGAAVSILSARLAASSGAGRRTAGGVGKDVPSSGPLSDLLGELMGLIVLPYLGQEAAQEERTRPAPTEPETAALAVPEPGSKQGGRYLALEAGPSLDPQPRLTYRTALVLEAIARAPGISNLAVARYAQINDQGQISKLLSRLERNGLIRNTGRGQSKGAPNEWRLTPAGQKLEQGIRAHQKQAA